jgi:hypothetical protein
MAPRPGCGRLLGAAEASEQEAVYDPETLVPVGRFQQPLMDQADAWPKKSVERDHPTSQLPHRHAGDKPCPDRRQVNLEPALTARRLHQCLRAIQARDEAVHVAIPLSYGRRRSHAYRRPQVEDQRCVVTWGLKATGEGGRPLVVATVVDDIRTQARVRAGEDQLPAVLLGEVADNP